MLLGDPLKQLHTTLTRMTDLEPADRGKSSLAKNKDALTLC